MAEQASYPSAKNQEGKADLSKNPPTGDHVPDPKNIQDLTQYVQTLLQQMQDKFQVMSDQILSRIDEMGHRIDDLEKNITELMTQAGVDEAEK
ncbi:heat shock factor-binding protein 1-like [Ornithodoros turicata]|uniref:Heat shock factor-binding protein 1 n=1 Tax=Ornithodoros turicata TaxID=34597 RepID=A0A2R5LEH7_9ACAR